jgi:hypothetical protein
VMCSIAASSFGDGLISIVTGCGFHGASTGWAVSSMVVVGEIQLVREERFLTRREGGRLEDCHSWSYSWVVWMEVRK